MRSLVLVLCVGLLACGSDGDAMLRVDLRTDLRPGAEFDAIELTVDGDPAVSQPAADGDYLTGVRLAEIDGVATGSRELVLRLRLEGSEVASRRVILDVAAPFTTVTIVVAASCAERECPGPGDPPDATECDFRGCIPPEVEPPDDMGAPDPDLGPVCTDPCDTEDCNQRGWCDPMRGCLCDPGYGGDRCDRCEAPWEPFMAGAPGPQCAPVDRIVGTDGPDELTAAMGGSFVGGRLGDDTILGRFFSDRLEGDGGDDTIDGATGNDELAGGEGADILRGGGGADLLEGGGGDDQLDGGNDVDRLVGGPGNDMLQGGAGNDRYLLDGLGDDVIIDEDGVDTAQCAPGVRVVEDREAGTARILVFDTGGSVRLNGNTIENVFCCR